MSFLRSLIEPALRVVAESPLIGKVIVGGAVAAYLIGNVLAGEPWNHQRPELKWTAAGIEMVKEVDLNIYEMFGKPQPGDAMTTGQLDTFFAFNIFTDQILDRGLATGKMTPRKFGVLGALYDFLFVAGVIANAIGLCALTAYGLGSFGVLTYARAPLEVATHFFGYLYVLLHTMFVVFAHLGMAGDAKKVAHYNGLGEAARPHVAKPYHLVMWAEQAAGDGPQGSHPYDAHTWPPLVYMPPAAIVLYQKGYILVDLPGLALIALGSPHAYLAIWGCYLCAALTDHLLLFGGAFSDRIKTVLPVRGINMLQYATWVIYTHCTSPAAVSLTASLTELGLVAAVAMPAHLAMMLAIGARPSRRPGGIKKA